MGTDEGSNACLRAGALRRPGRAVRSRGAFCFRALHDLHEDITREQNAVLTGQQINN